MNIFLTGANGFVGRELLQALLRKGHRVHALLRHPNQVPDTGDPNLVRFTGDITKPETLLPAMRGCEAVYHIAAFARMQAFDRSRFYKVNTEGTRHVLEAAARSGVRKLVFTSTAGVMGPSLREPICESDPRITSFSNDYELSKMLAEQLVTECASRRLFDTVIVSPSAVFGPGQETYSNALTRFSRNFLRRGFAFVPMYQQALANYTFIEDLVEGHQLAMEHGRSGEKYLLGGENLSLASVLAGIRQAVGNKGIFIPLPRLLLQPAFSMICQASALFRRDAPVSPELLHKLYYNRCLCCEKAAAELGYRITPFETAITKTIHHIKNDMYEKQELCPDNRCG